ncbi:hypothetical protein [Kitasatospora sp. CB01950]|uniref:hypothetical protein n=1 Tax=Kitasatospora sp. CB01950 TaxID=1703930 RepID=UPI00093DBD95|nr:hypothetical protein [Kitasatospora sp. CB01950]
MPICQSCGAAVAGAVATCANCGKALAAPPPAIGEVVVDGTASPWGAGRIHQDRQWPTPSRGWLTAGRVLLAPTVLLVLLAALGSTVGGRDVAGVDDDPGVRWTTQTFQMWLQLTLTAFGTPMRNSNTSSYGTIVVGIHVLPYLVALGWLALLWCGQRIATRARADAPTAGAAGAQALRTGALSATAALVLGWISTGSTHKETLSLDMHITAGPAMAPLGVSAFLAAAVVVLAVDGQGVLRAEAARRRWLGGWLLAWQHAARVVGGLLVLLTVVSVVMQVLVDRPFPQSAFRALTVNGGGYLFGVGSGARVVARGVRGGAADSFALYDLGEHGGQWWLAVVPVLLAALALGWSAHRGRLPQLDRARLAVLYAALTSALVLGTSIWGNDHTIMKGEVRDTRIDLLGWSLPTVLLAAAAWAVFGALVVPAVLDAVRRTPVPVSAPLPAQPTDGPDAAAGPIGLVEPVEEERSAVGHVDLLDSHAAYRRPDAG